MKKCRMWPGKLLEEVSANIDAAAFFQEQTYGQIIGKTLKELTRMRLRQEKAKEMSRNKIQESSAPGTSILPNEYACKGAILDDNT